METRVIKAFGDPERDRELIRTAAGIFKEGGIAAIPTETVYGLAGDARDPESAKKIYKAKGRPSDNPLIVHIAELSSLPPLVKEIPGRAERLMEAFWPGPLTLVFPKSGLVPPETTGGLDTVAVRFPVHPVARELISAAGGYLAAPSANRSGRPSCTEASHVLEDMDGRIPLIVDAGPVGIGLESTIVDLTGERAVLLRPGFITKVMAEEALGEEIAVDPAVDGEMAPGMRPRAPGMKYRHYAPKGEMVIVNGRNAEIVEAINILAEKAHGRGKKTGVLSTEENAGLYKADIVRSLGAASDGDSQSRKLFSALREMDSSGAECIFAEELPKAGIGMAVMNRMIRAAGHKVCSARDVIDNSRDWN